jgi:hypothetical protein
VRFSPKSIFVGLLAVGLPVAIAIGWTLGGRALVTGPAPAAAPGGSGALGTAPAPDTADATATRPVWLPGSYDNRPGQPAASAVPSPPGPGVAPPTSATTTTPRGPLITLTTLPPLTDPPVPTPTMVTSEPPPPTATPSETASAPEDTHGGIGAGLLRRR